MTIKLNTTKIDALNTFKSAITSSTAKPEQISEAMEGYVTALAEDAAKQVRAEYDEIGGSSDTQVLQARGIDVLTGKETKFYNEVVKKGGFDEDMVWPETILERVFENLQKERPLLSIIKFSPTVGREKVIKSRRKGVAVFGPLHKDLEGQLDAEFGATEFTQLALTAFFLISNDTLDLGPRWINRYIQICLKEAIAEIWEKVIITGTGKNEPIGLMKDLDGAVTAGVYPDKASAGTLTFKDSDMMIREMSIIMKLMSQYTFKISPNDPGTKEFRNISGKIYLLVNPANYYDIIGNVTTQTADGTFVSILPFISIEQIIQSVEVPENKLLSYVDGEYDANQSRPEKVYTYKETFAMKRATLFAVDMLANGQPVNNDAAQVWDLTLNSK
ncbi:phage major capsid protein [uncultured Vagococcus sp.]|uniref:phage major capsid protein n=1 Tax=uncultured Vagococcus sp. TaxID=189676 RepID=UPI0028D69D20|nr:phage major capsid protein [uncultured Vagococcus sp.]